MKESETEGFYCSPGLQITANVLRLKVSAPIISIVSIISMISIISTVLANTLFISRSIVDNIKAFEANIEFEANMIISMLLLVTNIYDCHFR